MKANELRTGNKVYFEGMLLTVKEIKEHDATFFETPAAVEYPDIDPVPLSAEILEACGLEMMCYPNEDGCIIFRDKVIFGTFYQQAKEVSIQKVYPRRLKYLHELQNYIFIMTGTELTINLEKVKV